MEGRRFLRSIRLRNILSYGPDTEALDLEPLNVFIGPNASGKSNLIEALSILAAAPRDVQKPIREGGGIVDWLWKGETHEAKAIIGVTVENPFESSNLKYQIEFSQLSGRFHLVDEVVENEPALEDGKQSSIYYAFRQGTPVLNAKTDSGGVRTVRSIDKRGLKLDQSILSQRRDPESYPELTYLGDRFAEMAFFRELYLGRSMAPRHPQKTDLPTDWLLEDGVNLALVLNDMFNSPQIKEKMLSHLKEFYEGIVDVTLKIQGGTVQVFVHEVGLHHPIPAERLSDGTLRYLCLLAVLCHPEPPPVVCIEEPELGLHPDIVMKLAPLLLEAATRTQLFVTTHSDVLVDALSEVPEAVVVCERGEKGSTLHRLDRGLMQAWLEDHHLGELWVMGEIGGNPR